MISIKLYLHHMNPDFNIMYNYNMTMAVGFLGGSQYFKAHVNDYFVIITCKVL